MAIITRVSSTFQSMELTAQAKERGASVSPDRLGAIDYLSFALFIVPIAITTAHSVMGR